MVIDISMSVIYAGCIAFTINYLIYKIFNFLSK